MSLDSIAGPLVQEAMKKIATNINLMQPGSLRTVLDKLKSMLIKSQNELQKLDEILGFHDSTTRQWFLRLMHLASEINGILEYAQEFDSAERRGMFKDLADFASGIRLKLAEKIDSLLVRFELLYSEKSSLELKAVDLAQYRETSYTLPEMVVIGREEEKDELVHDLFEAVKASTSPILYGIVGLPGIGKTTLAQLIYNDETMIERFGEDRFWVWVSMEFDVKKVMRGIIECCTGKVCKLTTLASIQKCLEDLLRQRRFLLVLDDIWDDDTRKWDQLKSSLRLGVGGSIVIITTRLPSVASVAVGHNQHDVMQLDEEQCWDLFKRSAFPGENKEFEVIGKEIIKKCGGLPLVVESLGRSMRFMREVSEWNAIKDGEIWQLEQANTILRTFRLSVHDLDSFEKMCFEFCSVYPKGSYITKEHLIQLWIANNLIPLPKTLSAIQVAEKIYRDLRLKGLLQGTTDLPMLHTLMHDLGRSLRNECLSVEGCNLSKIPPHVLHLFIKCPDISSDSQSTVTILEKSTKSESQPSLHTCIVTNVGNNKLEFENLDYLRVLDLSNNSITNLEESLLLVTNLRYLDLSWTHLTSISPSINRMKKLVCLKLRGCSKLVHLPNDISKLTRLRQLDLRGCTSLTRFPENIGNLTHLRLLGLYVVGSKTGRVTELTKLKYLRNDLVIKGLEHVNESEFKAVNKKVEPILKCTKISSLTLIWEDSKDEAVDDEVVLAALEPPQTLNEILIIEGYRGSVFPSWSMGLLEGLVKIEIKNCTKLKCLPCFGQIPQLKVLTIVGMESIKYIGSEFYKSSEGGDGRTVLSARSSGSSLSSPASQQESGVFPSLESLKIESMSAWEQWHDIESNIQPFPFPCPRLQYVKLSNCPKLVLLPFVFLSSIQHLEIQRCHKVKLPCFTSLQTLIIEQCNGLESLFSTLKNLSILQVLTVSNCDQLEFSSNDFEDLGSLTTLHLNGLPKVTILPGLQNLSTLELVRIDGCPDIRLGSEGFKSLRTLKNLDLSKCGQLELSSEDFTSLVRLEIASFHNLPKFISFPEPEDFLPTLRMNVSECENLVLSPAWDTSGKLHRQDSI